jgi:hypothetical protein
MVSTLMVVYLEEGGQSGSLRWCTWREKDGLYPDDGLPGASRLVSILMVEIFLERWTGRSSRSRAISLVKRVWDQGAQSGHQTPRPQAGWR